MMDEELECNFRIGRVSLNMTWSEGFAVFRQRCRIHREQNQEVVLSATRKQVGFWQFPGTPLWVGLQSAVAASGPTARWRQDDAGARQTLVYRYQRTAS